MRVAAGIFHPGVSRRNLNEFQLSEVFRPVIIRLFRAYGIPGHIMRIAQLVAALVEIGPEALTPQTGDLMMKEGFKRNCQGQ